MHAGDMPRAPASLMPRAAMPLLRFDATPHPHAAVPRLSLMRARATRVSVARSARAAGARLATERYVHAAICRECHAHFIVPRCFIMRDAYARTRRRIFSPNVFFAFLAAMPLRCRHAMILLILPPGYCHYVTCCCHDAMRHTATLRASRHYDCRLTPLFRCHFAAIYAYAEDNIFIDDMPLRF